MAEIRINATGGVKLFDADDSHYAQIVAGTITSNVDAITLGHDVVSIVDNLALTSDSAVLKFGADNDTTLTHTDGTGLTLNSTNKLCFNDASQFVQGSSNAILSLGATDEIDLTATAIDINGTCDISGTFSLGGTNITTTAAEINLIDGGTARGTTALADGDGILINDAGTMRMTNVTAVKTYMATAALAGIDDQSSSNDDQLTITDSAVVINEDSDDLDFRIEGNSLANLFYVDAGEDKIYMGVASKGVVAAGHEPSFYMEGTNDADSTIGLTQNSNNNSGPSIVMSSTRGTSVGAVTIVQDDDYMGNIYWGAADGNDKITYGAQISARVDGTPGENDLPTRIIFATTADGAASPSERMAILQTGSIDIAGGYTTSGDAGISFDVGGEMNVSRAGTGEQEMMRFANGNGLVGTVKTSGSSTSFNTSSDYRLKENETSITDGIDRIKQLKPYRFNFKTDADKTVDGFFAHEVFSIVPEAISGEKDSMIPEVLYTDKDKLPEGKNIGDVKEETRINPQGIDQSKLVPLLVAAVKELTAKVEALENA